MEENKTLTGSGNNKSSDLSFAYVEDRFGCKFPGKYYFKSPNGSELALESKHGGGFPFPGEIMEVCIARPVAEGRCVLVRKGEANSAFGPVAYYSTVMWQTDEAIEAVETRFLPYGGDDAKEHPVRYKSHTNPHREPEIGVIGDASMIPKEFIIKAWACLPRDAALIINDSRTVLTEDPIYRKYLDISGCW